MKLFGLTPEQIRQSSETSDLGPTKSLTASMLYGTLSFAIVSTLAYSLWAFRLVRGEALLFTAIAVVYLGLSGLALGRLLSISYSIFRFTALFALSFLLYAIAWCCYGSVSADNTTATFTVPPLDFSPWPGSSIGLSEPPKACSHRSPFSSRFTRLATMQARYAMPRSAGKPVDSYGALVTDWDSEPA